MKKGGKAHSAHISDWSFFLIGRLGLPPIMTLTRFVAQPPPAHSASTATMGIPPFADNFWGEKDEGFDVLYNRMRDGKHACVDVHDVIAARAAIEDDYSKRLSKLAKATIGKDEIGTMKEALDTLRAELEQCAASHANLAAELKAKAERPLAEFINEQSAVRNITVAFIMSFFFSGCHFISLYLSACL